jgi:serine/threonine protein kinase
LKIAINVARALECLHMFDPPIVHRDIKSEIVYICSDNHAKIGISTISRTCSIQEEESQSDINKGTTRFMAPELFLLENIT